MRRGAAVVLTICVAVPVTAYAEDAATIRELLCGRTLHYYDDGIGNQIEYTAADGTAYLIHNDIDGVGIGTWEVTGLDGDDAQVCYTYEPGTFGPEDTGSQYCFDYIALISDVLIEGVRDGDPYRLSSGNKPFVLPLGRPVSLDALKAQYPDVPAERACGAMMM